MLNYLGNGSMPGGVPGAPANPLANRVTPLPQALASASGPGVGGPSLPPIPGNLPTHPALAAALSAIRGPMRGAPPGSINPRMPATPGTATPAPSEPHPSEHRYIPETQSDGSILLRLKLSDGKPGPVVKVVPAPKVPDNIKH